MTVQVVRLRRRPEPVQRVSGAVQRTAPDAQRGLGRAEIAARVAALKDQARRLRPPLAGRPEAWHEDKSDLVRALERLEDELRRPPDLPNSPDRSAARK